MHRRSLLRPKCRNDRRVGLGKRIGIEGLRLYPAHGLVLETPGLAVIVQHFMHIQQDLLVAVVMTNLQQRTVFTHRHTVFLAQLTLQGFSERFTRFNLATGKLPEPPLVTVDMSLREQEAPARIAQHADSHVNFSCGIQR